MSQQASQRKRVRSRQLTMGVMLSEAKLLGVPHQGVALCRDSSLALSMTRERGRQKRDAAGRELAVVRPAPTR